MAFLLLANWQSEFQAGEQHLQQGRLDQARKAFDSARKQAATGATTLDSAAILDALGRTEFAAAKFRLAQKWFEKAAASTADPASQAAILANLAQTHIAMGEYSLALSTIRRALEQMPGSSSLWLLLGQASFHLGDINGARTSLQKSIAFGGGPVVLNDLALIASAPELLEEALRSLPPGQARARTLANLGVMRWRSGHRQDAATYLKRALDEMEAAVGPNHPDVIRILNDYAAVLERTGRKAEAQALARRAAMTSSSSATVDWRDLR